MSKVSIYFVRILFFIYVKQRKEAYTYTKYIYMYIAQRLSFSSNFFFFRNTRHRHREGSPLKIKWFFITFRKSFGNPEPLPFFPHPPPTHDQSSLWNVTNSILLEKKTINFLDKAAGDHYEKCCRRRNKQYVYTSLSTDVRRKNCTASSWSLWHILTWYLSRLLVKIL